jgi:uncharacterized protein with HEPN domain
MLHWKLLSISAEHVSWQTFRGARNEGIKEYPEPHQEAVRRVNRM